MGNLRESLQIQVVSNTHRWGCCQNKVSTSGGSQGSTKFWQCAYTRVVTHVMTMTDEKETTMGSSEM
jgi:hypothetical protein